MLWPPLHPKAIDDSNARLLKAHQLADAELIPPRWKTPHDVHITHYGKAHAWAVTIATHSKTPDKLTRRGTIVHTWTTSSLPAATVTKYSALQRVTDLRCVLPSVLVETGRTDAARETPTTLARLLGPCTSQLCAVK